MSRLWKAFLCVGVLGLFLLMPHGAAQAESVTFNFDGCHSGTDGSCGGSFTFTAGSPTSFSITATAEGGNLYAKTDGSDENGLGLTSDTSGDHEITPGNFIQLSLSSIESDDPLTIIMGSTTGSDAWEICQTNTANSLTGCSSLATGNTEGSSHSITISPTDTYVDITATGGNVLLSSLSFSTPAPTPEPSGLALLGTGILGLAGAIRRKLKV